MYLLSSGIARESDFNFVGNAAREAERAHTGVGIWDIYANNMNCELISRALSNVARNAEQSIYYHSRYFLIHSSEGDKSSG